MTSLPDILTTLNDKEPVVEEIRNDPESPIVKRGPGKPKGTKNSYTQSPATYHQRCMAHLKDGKDSNIVQYIINKKGLTEEETQVLSQERVKLWKNMQTPVLLLMNEYSDLKTLINLERMRNEEILSKDVLKASELLLNIAKEMNRLTTVSADKKMEAWSKSWNGEEDITIEMNNDNTEEDE